MRAVRELVAARRAAETAIDELDSETVFAAVGCQMDEAAAFAHVRSAVILTTLNDLETEGTVAGEPLIAAAFEQAQMVWLNGCLVGLYVAGPTDETMASEALIKAGRILTLQQPKPGEDAVDATLRSLHLEPAALREGAEQVGVSFVRPLASFGVPSAVLMRCAATLADLWLNGITVATQARRESSPVLAA